MTLRIESDCSLSSTQRIVRFGFIVLFAVAQEKLGASDDWLFQSGMNRKAERHRLSSNADVNGTLAPLQKLFACACEHFFAVNTHPLSAENLQPAKLPQSSTACEVDHSVILAAHSGSFNENRGRAQRQRWEVP